MCEHPARDRAVIMLPLSRIIDQVLVPQHPLICRGAPLHGHRTDIGEEMTVPVFLTGTRTRLEQPVERVARISDEAGRCSSPCSTESSPPSQLSTARKTSGSAAPRTFRIRNSHTAIAENDGQAALMRLVTVWGLGNGDIGHQARGAASHQQRPQVGIQSDRSQCRRRLVSVRGRNDASDAVRVELALARPWTRRFDYSSDQGQLAASPPWHVVVGVPSRPRIARDPRRIFTACCTAVFLFGRAV